MNSLACIALCNVYGIDIKTVASALLKFGGAARRLEFKGTFNGARVYDDYGHHPTAVKTTLEGFRKFYSKRKIIVDFMSHTYSRTQALLKEFSESFDSADVVILHKIYSSARENPADFEITGLTLFNQTVAHLTAVKQNMLAKYYEEILDAKDFVLDELDKPLPPEYSDGYLLVTMGAGDNWKLGKAVLDTLKEVNK